MLESKVEEKVLEMGVVANAKTYGLPSKAKVLATGSETRNGGKCGNTRFG